MEKNKYNLSFGAELEWSDIDRSIDILKELGSWEGPKIAGYNLGSEIDIVNTKGEWRGVATDPLCLKCPVGGEIHVNPSWTIESQLIRIMRIMDLFPQVGVACPNHGHIHVGIQGIRQDLQAIKNLFEYTAENQIDVLKYCSGYSEEDWAVVAGSCQSCVIEPWVRDYLLIGDAKTINLDLIKRVKRAETLSEVWKALEEIEAVNLDWVSGKSSPAYGSHRTAVNLYSLLKMGSIEFRVFRASINPVEIYSSLLFSKRYVEEALKGKDGKPVAEILKEGQFKFAPLNFDEKLAKGWQETRQTKGRCGCLKKMTGICEPCEDVLIEDTGYLQNNGTSFEKGLYSILQLIKIDFAGRTLNEERGLNSDLFI